MDRQSVKRSEQPEQKPLWARHWETEWPNIEKWVKKIWCQYSCPSSVLVSLSLSHLQPISTLSRNKDNRYIFINESFIHSRYITALVRNT